MQLAIWDELANNGQGQYSVGATLSYTIPNATVGSDLATLLAAANASTGAVAAWLDSNVGYEPDGDWEMGQGFLAPMGATPNTPEPASIALLAIGAGSLFFFGRKRRRTS